MELKGKKIGVLMESDFYEKEIFYYQSRFPQEGMELHFLTRLWGQEKLTFKGHEERAPFDCRESFENMDDAALRNYAAIIIPSGYVADRLRYTEDPKKIPPAALFMQRAFADKNILKGIICHGLWLLSPVARVIKGRKLTVHNNLISDARNYGAKYIDADVVVDRDLVTARTGGHAQVFADKIIEILSKKVRG
ncbi:MAG: DJ-1/PfpI family protein [Candidatus Omnitrophica bacterium]|nr:DJ-1/PfpI family protein [Candidatus Omnitrophota bacterium]